MGGRWRGRQHRELLLAVAVTVAVIGSWVVVIDRPDDDDREELIGFPAPAPEPRPSNPPATATTTLASPTTTSTTAATTVVLVTVPSPPSDDDSNDSNDDGDGDGDGGEPGTGHGATTASTGEPTSVTADPMPPVVFEHQWDDALDGPVWIVVETPDAIGRTVVIRWGPWQRTLRHERAGRASYVFDKDPTRAGEQTVPTTVTVTPGGSVGLVFGKGSPPHGAIDVNDGWEPAPQPS